jgi:hypothetical protein
MFWRVDEFYTPAVSRLA